MILGFRVLGLGAVVVEFWIFRVFSHDLIISNEVIVKE